MVKRTPMETYKAGLAELQAKADWKPVSDWLMMRTRKAPGVTRTSMRKAAAWWESEAKPKVPVRASRNRKQQRDKRGRWSKGPLYSRVGRGQLRKQTHAFTEQSGDKIVGGIVSGASYAIWLAAGTRAIAGGRVLAWRPGAPLVTSWPAKRTAGAGVGYAAAMPIVIPWHRTARDRFVKELKEAL